MNLASTLKMIKLLLYLLTHFDQFVYGSTLGLICLCFSTLKTRIARHRDQGRRFVGSKRRFEIEERLEAESTTR